MRVIVTGSASGIGKASAARLKSQGAHVTGIDIADQDDGPDTYLHCDLSDPGAIAALPLSDPYDALVNAAGLPPRDGLETRELAVNFLGLRNLTEAAIPHLAPGAAIVSLASKAGSQWRANLEQVNRLIALESPDALSEFVTDESIDPVRAYDLSKEAVIVWTKFQTERLQSLQLRANTVSPAAVDTPILDDFVRAFGARANRGLVLSERAGTAAEIANVVAFLASPDSHWIMGQDIAVDGGLTARLDAEALQA